MDPSSIPPPSVPPPTAVPFPAEPNDHPPPPDPPANHPPYAEMIYTAIEALKEKNGSSKRAIGKYIEQVYKDQLPPNHSTLLTHHLNRLKTTGLLQMVKKSYALPRSAPLPGLAPQPLPPGGSPRPRGRPRKAQNPETANVQQNAEPVWAALGLADEPLQAESGKKRPGRPKKNAVPGAGPSRRGRPPGSVKRPGRPPKAKTDTAEASVGPKRGPGRPPKNQTQATPIPFAQPAGADPVAEPVAAAADAGAVLGPRARGRPKKYADEVVAAGRGRGRGRGRGGRGRGRGRGGLPAPPRPGARPVGRPKKGSTYASTSQNAANDDLRRKLEHFQSKVKESLAVLKPHFNHESPATAIAAIQDLEELGIMDLNAPLRDETLPHQEELPPPQPPVQPQQLQLPRQQLPPPPQQQQQPPQQNLPPQQLPPQAPIFPQDFPAFHLQPFQQHLQFQQQQQPQPPQLFQPPPQHHQQFHP
uniref:Histone H1 n=1 Tax=Cajanus cajan TaxID=3821 RepID=A0A151TEL4_CAJCA|nr:Histone H1 [Cajanus cajan]